MSNISNILYENFYEIAHVCENGVRVAALFDDCAVFSEGVSRRYDLISDALSDAIKKDVAFINEPYYEDRNILNKIAAVNLIQSDKLLSLYTSMLDWTDIKYSYNNPNADAFVWKQTQWINITGKIELMAWTDYSDVVISAYNKANGELLYLDSTYPNEDGSYRFSFKYDGNSEDLDIKINQGGILIENKNVETASEDMLITGVINVNEKTDTADIMLQIENYFRLTGKTVQAVMAFYDSEGRLIFCSSAKPELIEKDENMKSYSVEKPENAVLLKVFAWESVDSLKPVLDSNETELFIH